MKIEPIFGLLSGFMALPRETWPQQSTKFLEGKNRTVHDALRDRRWIKDINTSRVITAQLVQQFLSLWGRLSQITLNPAVADEITWKLTPHGNYTAKYAYAMPFFGSTITEFKKIIWKTSAPKMQTVRLGGHLECWATYT